MIHYSRLEIPDVILLTPPRFADQRGYFSEVYSKASFAEAGITADFVQDNESLSVAKGTIRGLHFQVPPKPQAKLVRVIAGSIFDVAVDLRAGSPFYGRWVGATLTASGGEQLFVPRGFAHAFCTLEPDTRVVYKVDGYYAKAQDAGIFWNDPDLAIQWPLGSPEEAVLSEKDRALPRLRDFASPFRYEPDAERQA